MENLTQNQAVGVGAILGGMATFAIIFYVFYVIASWKIFEKAGIKGWKSLIPIYNSYLTLKISGMQNWFWISIIVNFVVNIVVNANGAGNLTKEQMESYDFGAHPWLIVALAVYMIVLVYVMIRYAINTAKVFGKGNGFAVLMILFPNICWLVLAFGSAKYDEKALEK